MSLLPSFSHIYVERDARESHVTQRLLTRIRKATVIEIESYKELFNRPRQEWSHQKESLTLILAVRRDSFLYQGSPFVPNFDHTRFYYNTPVLNCLYGCEYCYLQGMFPSPNIVVFANQEDFMSEAVTTIGDAPAYLCISYDTDLLAFENLLGYCRSWISFAKTHQNITIEIRTKSPNFGALRDLEPIRNTVLAWTLSPDSIISRFEHKTPPLASRLASVKEAIQRGWQVRLCFDPLLLVKDWETQYSGMIETVFDSLDGDSLLDISIGVFRINSSYLRTMQSRNRASALVQFPYTVVNGSASYTDNDRETLCSFVMEKLKNYISPEKICPVPWQL